MPDDGNHAADGPRSTGLGRYVSDVPYTATYKQRLAPAWLDHVALINGFAPPARADGFAWCELGCGQGVTPVVLAATNPAGRFVGIDAAPGHVENARRFAADAGATNATFIAADFAAAARLDLPQFNYIVAHGVYSWIDEAGQRSLLDFIDRRLAPGGLVYLSYNALPGWAQDTALRRVILEYGRAQSGDSIEKVTAALAFARRLAAIGAPALAGSRVGGTVGLDPHYLAHEYLAEDARPLFVTEVRAATAAIDLVPVGSATLVENYDRFVLRSAAREVLDSVEDDDLRELVRDCCMNQGFRADVFARGAERIDDAERERRLDGSVFMLAKPAAAVAFEATTPAGTLTFDNPAARRVVAELARGPCLLADVRRGDVPPGDILANALTLTAADAVWPVEPAGALGAPARLTAAILGRLGGPLEILYHPVRNGAAVKVSRGLLASLRDGGPLDDYPGWREYLESLSGEAARAPT